MSVTPEVQAELVPFLLSIARSRTWHTFAILTDSINAAVHDVIDPMRELVDEFEPAMTVHLERKLCTVMGRRVLLVDSHWRMRGLRAQAIWLHGLPRGAVARELDFCLVPGGNIYRFDR